MKRKPSPHVVLGLLPGASREEIDAAYRRLMKQHHPDRAGGDAEAAKAIIAAYRTLVRGDKAAGKQMLVVVEAPPSARAPRRGWRGWKFGLLLLLGAGALWWAPRPKIDFLQPPPPPAVAPSSDAPERPVPLLLLPRVAPNSASVEAGVSEALRLLRQGREHADKYSRSCAADIRRLPGDGLLDHCLAFDMAAARHTSLESAATADSRARWHAEAAIRVLQDPLLAEARVREIRRQVDRRLADAD